MFIYFITALYLVMIGMGQNVHANAFNFYFVLLLSPILLLVVYIPLNKILIIYTKNDVNNYALVLSGAYSNDSLFNQNLKNIVKSNIIAIRKQIDLINDMNQDYFNLEKDIIDEVFNKIRVM